MVVAAVGVWWLLSGNGPQGPAGNDPRYAVPDVEVTGSATPGDSTPVPATPNGVLLDSYVVRDPLRLAVNYRVDGDCPADVEARVLENDATVTVTLSYDASTGSSCDGGGPTERATVGVLLDSPLDGRGVLDGSTSPQVRVEQIATVYDASYE